MCPLSREGRQPRCLDGISHEEARANKDESCSQLDRGVSVAGQLADEQLGDFKSCRPPQS